MSKPAQSARELCPEGTYPAICTAVIDLGTQVVVFKDEEKKQKKVLIEFELQGPTKENGTRFTNAMRVTNSASDRSTLAKTLKTWLAVKNPADYDLENLLGKHALVTISHSEDGQYSNVASVTQVPKGMKVGKPEAELRSLFLDETYDADVFDSLGDKLKEKIMLSPEYVALSAPKPKKAAKKK